MFVVPAIGAAAADSVVLYLRSSLVTYVSKLNEPGDDMGSNEFLYNPRSTRYLLYFSDVRLIFLFPLFFFNVTGKRMKLPSLYHLTHIISFGMYVAHLSALLFYDDDIATKVTIDSSRFLIDSVDELSRMLQGDNDNGVGNDDGLHGMLPPRALMLMLLLSIISSVLHEVILIHLRTTAPPRAHIDTTEKRHKQQLFMAYAYRNLNLSPEDDEGDGTLDDFMDGHDYVPLLTDGEPASLNDDLFKSKSTTTRKTLIKLLEQTRTQWTKRLDEVSIRLTSTSTQNLPITFSDEIKTFRILLQMYAYQEVLTNGLLSKCYDRDGGKSLVFYLPQLTSFLVHGAYFNAAQLEAFLLEKCHENLYMSHITYWFLRSWCLTGKNGGTAGGTHLTRPRDSPLLDTTATAAAAAAGVTQNSFFESTSLSRTPSAVSLPPQNNRNVSYEHHEMVALQLSPRSDNSGDVVGCFDRTNSESFLSLYQDTSADNSAIDNKKKEQSSRQQQRKNEEQKMIFGLMEKIMHHGNRAADDLVKKQLSYDSVYNISRPVQDFQLQTPKNGFFSQQFSGKSTDPFLSTPKFFDTLLDIADDLIEVEPREKRTMELRSRLESIAPLFDFVSNLIYVPLGMGNADGGSHETRNRIYGIVEEESIALSTKERVPCIITLEIVRNVDVILGSLDQIKSEDEMDYSTMDEDDVLNSPLKDFPLTATTFLSRTLSKPLSSLRGLRRQTSEGNQTKNSQPQETSSPISSSLIAQNKRSESDLLFAWVHNRRFPQRHNTILEIVSSLRTRLNPFKDNTSQGIDILNNNISNEHEKDNLIVSTTTDSANLPSSNYLIAASSTIVNSELQKTQENDICENIEQATASKFAQHATFKVPISPNEIIDAETGKMMGQWSSPSINSFPRQRKVSTANTLSIKGLMPQRPSIEQHAENQAASIKRSKSDGVKTTNVSAPYYGSTTGLGLNGSVDMVPKEIENENSSHAISRRSSFASLDDLEVGTETFAEGLTTSASFGNPSTASDQGHQQKELKINKSTPHVVFRECWSEKEARIRPHSKHSHKPGWRLMPVLIKSNDDLRQEQLASQLIRRMALILAEAKVPVWLCPYEILALTNRGGIIEAIPDTISIDSLKKNDPSFTTLKEFFLDHFGEVGGDTHAGAKANFVESLAGYSIVSYLLQIKDRHNGNILLDNKGHLIHIDFGFYFLSSPGKNSGFEAAPFKLTRDFVRLMDGPNSRTFAKFRELCVRTFLALRKQCYQIILLVEMIMEGNEEMPCFRGRPEVAVRELRERFRLDLNDRACMEYVNNLIDESLENWRTRWYDRYQRYCVGVL